MRRRLAKKAQPYPKFTLAPRDRVAVGSLREAAARPRSRRRSQR